MVIDFVGLQYLQIAAASGLFVFAWGATRIFRRPVVNAPFVFIVPGYCIASAASNLVRFTNNDVTSLDNITLQQYTTATVWWLISVFVFTVIYISSFTLSQPAMAPYRLASIEISLLKRQRQPYAIAALILLGLIFLNPFRRLDFGVISATSQLDLSVGGLLVGGLLTISFSSVAVPIMATSLLLGLGCISISVILLLNTGSKAIATIYLLVAGLQFWRGRRKRAESRRHNGGIKRKLIGLAGGVLLFFVAGSLLLVSVARRYRDSEVSITSAVAPTVVRFTQQDVAALIFAKEAWRHELSPRYVADTFSSFVPGFIWPDKPINPAYEINALWGHTFSAASPSLFGAILLGSDGKSYWIILIISALGLGLWDRTVTRTHGVDLSPHVQWLSFYSAAMLFEANFVIWTVQAILLITWRLYLSHALTALKRRAPLLASGLPATATAATEG